MKKLLLILIVLGMASSLMAISYKVCYCDGGGQVDTIQAKNLSAAQKKAKGKSYYNYGIYVTAAKQCSTGTCLN